MEIMKQILRNLCITLMSVLGIAFVFRVIQKKKGPLVRVVVFHDVDDASSFEETISFLHMHYHVISPQDFLESHFDDTRINVLITFDDGYASWVEVCLSILRAHTTQALFFVNSGLIDAYGSHEQVATYVRDRLLLGTSRKTLSWEGVRALKDGGHTIGGHTTTHARLSELSNEVARTEIEGDKRRLETVLGDVLKTFAYPFGEEHDYTADTRALVASAGYTHAFTTESAFVRPGDSYAIPRICIEDNMTTKRLARWVEGGYDIYTKIKKLCVR